MKKIFWLVIVGVFLTSGLLLGSDTQAQAQEKAIRLTYSLFQPATAHLSLKNTEFAKDLEKRSNGRLKITVYQAGSLLNGPATWEGVKTGVADMGNNISAFIPGVLPFSSICELPTNAQSGWACVNAKLDFMEKYKPKEWDIVHLVTLAATPAEIMCTYTARAPVIKLEDFKGKTFKCVQADILTALGGTLKDMPNADLYEAMSKGVVDGCMSHPEPLKAWKFAEVSKYVTITTVPLQPSTLWFNIMNRKKWDSLPPDIQKVFNDAQKEWSGKLALAWDDQAVAGIEAAKSGKCQISITPPEEAARWGEAVKKVTDNRLKSLVAKGFPEQEVTGAWKYFQERVEYWNGQQAKNNVVPILERIKKLL